MILEIVGLLNACARANHLNFLPEMNFKKILYLHSRGYFWSVRACAPSPFLPDFLFFIPEEIYLKKFRFSHSTT